MRQEEYEAVEIVPPGQDMFIMSCWACVSIVAVEIASMAELSVTLAASWINSQIARRDAKINKLKLNGIHNFVYFFHVIHLFVGVVLTEANVVGF